MRGLGIDIGVAVAKAVRRGGRFGCRLRLLGFRILEQRRQFGIFDGGMKLLLARAGGQRVIGQTVFGMKTLHLFESVGAVNAAADAYCPGFRHDTLGSSFAI